MSDRKIIRDSIHGNIVLDSMEVELVDTPPMQRLRNIKQNGLCYLIYPAMNSTRFEHSLGVFHLASVMAAHLNLTERQMSIVRAAGLLHDVGHYPLSHTTDDLLSRMGFPHEKNSSRIVLETEISSILKKYGLNPKRVSDLILGEGELSKIISSEIDIDKMDYLTRDAYYAGVAYGVVDLERIIFSLKMVGGEIVVDKGGLEAVESLLISRSMMYQTVYRHHTKRIVETMLKNVLSMLLEAGRLSYDELSGMDDISLINFLRKSDEYTREIMERIDERRLFKTAYKEKLSKLENLGEVINNRRQIESQIAQDFGLKQGFVFVDVPEPKFSEFRVKVEVDGELKSINQISHLAKALEHSEREKLDFCVYTSPEYSEKIKDFKPEKYFNIN